MTLTDPGAVPQRFAGPPDTTNGGYVAGLLATRLPGEGFVTVRLAAPCPLDTPLTVATDGTDATLWHGEAAVARAAPATHDDGPLEPVDPASYDEAVLATARYRGRTGNPFPGCFVCGPERTPGDGMRLEPGEIRPQTVATPWVPDDSLGDGGRVPEEFVWAALDCPGAWTLDLAGRPILLGTITGHVDERPYVGDRCVVMGRFEGTEGRKTYTTTTAYDGDGRVLGRARHVWIQPR